MNKFFLVLIFWALVFRVLAQDPGSETLQTISGTVLDKTSGKPIFGANVYWLENLKGITSNDDGSFELPVSVDLPSSLVVSYVGYEPDTMRVSRLDSPLNVRLSSTIQIGVVEVNEERAVFTMSAASKLNTETINRGVLRKAACCNLSESFDATATVDVVLNDAVTGARTIQMLGLEGAYVQNLFEGIPFSRGLGNVLGFDQIPGPWINAIELTKGVAGAANGYESMTGQINLEFLPADGEEMLRADIFGNNQGRYETNVIWNTAVGSKWATAIFAAAHTQNMEVDQNGDNFLDMPLREGYKLMNRWKYNGDFLRAHIIAKYAAESRNSGQVGFERQDDLAGSSLYGFGMDYEQIEVMGKLGILSKDLKEQGLYITGLYSYTDVDAFFGRNPYVGTQETIRANATFDTKFDMYSDHHLIAGAQYLHDDYQESFSDSAFARTERVPGVFAEYTFTRPRFEGVVGARADFHNLFGTQFSPRMHVKYNLRPLTTLRATLGRGFRTPNAFADQLGLLASSRDVRVLETPEAETSWNTGVSFLHKFQLFGREALVNVDYYYTDFQNKLVVDRDFSSSALLFYNLDGRAFAHSFQTDFQAELVSGLGFKASYKYQDVYSDMLQGRLRKPMISRHRFLANLGYTTAEGKWFFDITANYYGEARLPSTSADPAVSRPGTRSVPYVLINSQVTRVFGSFEVYAGVENLNNFIQANAIIDAENPFGPNFDATVIYSPLNGRTFYLGARMNLKTNKK